MLVGVYSVAFSPDGNQIVSGSSDQSVKVWDAKTGKQLRELQGHTDDVNSVAFSPDGKQIVSGSVDKSVQVWDAKTGEQLRKLQGHTRGVYSVAFSPGLLGMTHEHIRATVATRQWIGHPTILVDNPTNGNNYPTKRYSNPTIECTIPLFTITAQSHYHY
jgi:WD40 repeat protein